MYSSIEKIADKVERVGSYQLFLPNLCIRSSLKLPTTA